MAFSTYFHYDEQFNKSYPGQVPVGWSTSPLLMDLYPSLINKLWNYAPDYYEYVANWGDMNDINVLSGTGGWNKWTTDYKNYYDAMGFYTTNTFSRSNKYLDANQPYFNMIYYRYASPFTKYGPTVISGTSKLGDVESNVREQIDGYPAGQPAFALVCLGNGRDFNNEVYNRNINQRIKTAMDALNANPEGRTYHFLKPKDLAATYNAYYPQRVINAYTGDDNSGKIEAESYSSQSGTQLENCIEGGQDIAYIDNGDYLKFNDVDFGSGAAVFSARVASNNSNGGYLEVR
ncbi:MAG: carbohydrate-binding protein, partial [Taibaiella sp.]|nr:carbohydrate-binding protein [Taibaiella sp.]